ncbi:ANTAR domain-containing protein [Oerskovia turbata]|uniref:ANTAR domain-containing protein n=1 Tax=Oerskovia turbata TaxID=1713 RepID=A0A4Q1KZJ9_9CELL|nr:PAS and ANTAR domain-containing protein [Oerskovia turbata]RXR25054.1 ANTAR domain-containing protein [Oerskovia turbata]RXR35200.1 ANTAR domain-containing protein [Oerskovia turbata]TGJ96441.1 ANTAR domain-containing protein [Actinotalea fermentans ATCC 43279 = JCM 9966 = DSM 3133]
MAQDENDKDGRDLEAALLAGGPQPVARYTLDVPTGRWWWSDELFEMHGFAPHEVVPTTQLMLAHKHPEDVARVAGVLADVTRTGDPFSCTHRIVDATGRTRILGVVGQGDVDPATGEVTQVAGYFMDLTDSQEALAQAHASRAVSASAARRATIEQAKGALMVVYGLDDDEAFEVLRHHSSVTNEPVRELAARLLASLAGGTDGSSLTREDLDHFFEVPRPPTRTSQAG